MIANYLYVLDGPPISCHEQLYREGTKKLLRHKNDEVKQQIDKLKFELAELAQAQHSPVKATKDFYTYSMKWKNRIKQKTFQQHYQPEQSEISKREITNLPAHYISPIDGWKEHAINYQERRTVRLPEQDCQPSINLRSKELTFAEPVEDRLIKFGVEREKRVQLAMQWDQFYAEVEKSQKPTRPNEEVFERLCNYEKKPVKVETYSLNLNKLPPRMEERINKRREQYSLFEPKPTVDDQEFKEQDKQLSRSEFLEFLSRNLQKTQQQLNIPEQETIEEIPHPFKPDLNKKSLMMASQLGQTMQERDEKRRLKTVECKPEAKIHVTKQQQLLPQSQYSLHTLLDDTTNKLEHSNLF